MKDRGNRIRIIDILDELLSIKSTGMFLELDIDHFKKINDTYGHQAGDQVILAVADALRSTFRSNDITIRLAGTPSDKTPKTPQVSGPAAFYCKASI